MPGPLAADALRARRYPVKGVDCTMPVSSKPGISGRNHHVLARSKPNDLLLHANAMYTDPAQEQTPQSQAAYVQLNGLCTDALFLVRQERIVYANQAAAMLFGCASAEQLIGNALFAILRSGEQPEHQQRMRTAIAFGNRRATHEFKLSCSDGRLLDAEITVGPYIEHVEHAEHVRGHAREQSPEQDHEQNRLDLHCVIVRDLTRLRGLEQRLDRREREFKTLIENSPDIISRIDRGMRHLYANPAIEKLAGLAVSAWLGKTKTELGLPPSVARAWDQAAFAAFETGLEQKLEFDHMIDGEMRYFSGRVIPEIDSHGRIESVVGIAYDVTQRARMEKERDELLARERAARIQAETAARARDEFLAIVSHELRAPLNGIQSWAHVLENYVKDATAAPLAQRALQGIKTGVAQQVRLIEDLLDVTRMMSGRLRLVKEPMPLLPVIEAAVESVRGMASAKRIRISSTYRIDDEQVDGDSDRIQQVIWNLLSNAIKFTSEGGNVWIAAAPAGKDICVTISDDGAGISPDFLPHLFNRFSQEDTSSTRDHSGLGLGLFLVRHLIELHGGRVAADSGGEGKGTTFSIYLPLRLQEEKYIPAAGSGADELQLPSLGGLRILLIDDQVEARESLTIVLINAGAKVFAAASARDALDWLPTLGSDEYPDVLVCDIAMPGEDGYAVLRKIRAWAAQDGTTPLQRMPALALTAFAQREDRIRALTAGFQMHVTKPVAPEELIVVIDTMAARA
jgi:PAS domain S-box-containing protein